MTGNFEVLDEEKLKRHKTVIELLRVAKCPNAHCVDGVISEGFAQDYEHFQCQFCHERELALNPREGE